MEPEEFLQYWTQMGIYVRESWKQKFWQLSLRLMATP
jgi:hypothetical protein